jgi:hypothetical protein
MAAPGVGSPSEGWQASAPGTGFHQEPAHEKGSIQRTKTENASFGDLINFLCFLQERALPLLLRPLCQA